MTHTGSKRGFYVLIGVLNLAVGVMFYAVLTPRLVPPIADARPVHSPVVRLARQQVVPAITGIPQRIVIPSLQIDLNVGIGSYDASSNSWTTDAVQAFYADPSLPVNNSNGRTLVYGHAQPQVFGRLPGIQPGAEVLIYTDTNYVFHYTYTSAITVVPTDTSIFTADGPPTLVLQTCTGDWDAYRALFSFTLTSQEKT